MAFFAKGLFELRYLIAFGQIRIKIVLSCKGGHRPNGAVGGQGQPSGKGHRATVQDRQTSRQSQAHGTDLGVGLSSEAGAAAAKYFRLGGEMNMDFESDDWFKGGHGFP